MKVYLKDKEGTEFEYEFPPVGEGQTVKFPLLFAPKSGGRFVPLSHVEDEKVIEDLFSKTIALDPDFRALYYAEIFVQLLGFKVFRKLWTDHFVVNHVIDPDGRFFKLVVEYCPDGVKFIKEEERDLIYDEAFRND